MPASENRAERRTGRLLVGLFWIGVAIAPGAALLLLFGDDTRSLRLAVVLAVLAIVLIGLSITLRQGAEAARTETEELLYSEMDGLRDDLREDIAAAARATRDAL